MTDLAGGGATPPILDCDAIVQDIQRRARARSADTAYDQTIIDTPFTLPTPRVALRTELVESGRPVVGKVLTPFKRGLLRLQYRMLDDLVGQMNAALASLNATIDSEREARRVLEQRVREFEHHSPDPGGAVEQTPLT